MVRNFARDAGLVVLGFIPVAGWVLISNELSKFVFYLAIPIALAVVFLLIVVRALRKQGHLTVLVAWVAILALSYGVSRMLVNDERKYLAIAVPAMTCELVADIFNSGWGFGRSWTPDGALMVESPPPVWYWSITLYIQRYDDMYAVRQDHFLGRGVDYTRQCGAGYEGAFKAADSP